MTCKKSSVIKSLGFGVFGFRMISVFHFRWDVAIKKARGRTTSEVTQSEFGEMVTIERTQQDLVNN